MVLLTSVTILKVSVRAIVSDTNKYVHNTPHALDRDGMTQLHICMYVADSESKKAAHM